MKTGYLVFRDDYIDGRRITRLQNMVDGPVFRIADDFIFYSKLFEFDQKKRIAKLGVLRFKQINARLDDLSSEFVLMNHYLWWWYVFQGWLEYKLQLKQRILMTFWVWGLAHRDPAMTMDWGDLRFIRWLKRIVRRR